MVSTVVINHRLTRMRVDMSYSETCGAPIGVRSFKDRFEAFLANPNYIILVMLLCGLANIASQELIVYGIYTLLAVYILVFAQDILGLMPLVMAYYLAPSTINNPGRNHLSVFSFAQGGWLILIYGVLLAIALLIRIVKLLQLQNRLYAKMDRSSYIRFPLVLSMN